MLDRYGEELEWDLQHLLRIDVSEFFSGSRGWTQFLRLVRQMPRDSHFMAAQHSDPEAAREFLRQNPELLDEDQSTSKSPPRSLDEWTPEVELLTTLVNEIRGYRADYAYVSAQGKGSRKKPDLVPGPKSALEVELQRARHNKHDDIRARLLPHKYGAGQS